MKQININDIVLNKTYYAVCCGSISEVIFKEKRGKKILAYYHSSDFEFEHEEYLSDIGIEYKNNTYINDLNIICKTKKEAEDIIHDDNYQNRLKEWNEECDYYDDITDDCDLYFDEEE